MLEEAARFLAHRPYLCRKLVNKEGRLLGRDIPLLLRHVHQVVDSDGQKADTIQALETLLQYCKCLKSQSKERPILLQLLQSIAPPPTRHSNNGMHFSPNTVMGGYEEFLHSSEKGSSSQLELFLNFAAAHLAKI